MKRYLYSLILFASVVANTKAQTESAGQSGNTLPDPITWPAIARDRCSTTRQLVYTVTNASTRANFLQTNTIVQVAPNYLDQAGFWQEPEDLIELTPDGGAAALRCPTKIYLSPSLGTKSDPGITLVTLGGSVLRTCPFGIYFFDQATGKEALLATSQESVVAELLPPNRIVWPSVFKSDVLEASVRITCTRAAMECDVIITKKPKLAPADFGMDPNSTVLQTRHVWLTGLAPRIFSRELQPGIRDDFIDFGDILFAPGKAFAWDGLDPTAPNSPAQITFLNPVLDPSAVPVAKRWTAIDATTSILMESVKWTDVQPALSQLPEMAKVSSPGSSGGHDELQNSPSPQGTDFKRRRIELASATQKNPGVVLDYLMVSGNGDYEFSTFNGVSNAYYLTGNNVFNGKVTFDASCVIKRARGGASLILAGTVACNGNATQPSILTMEDDDVFGQGDLIPPNNVNCPQITSGPAVWVWYSMPGTVGLSGLRVRFAQTAVQFDGSACATDRIVANSLFDNCTTGIYATNCKLTISTLTVCDVATPIASTGCAVSGGYSPPATLADQIISATQAATGPTKNGQIWNYSTNGYPISWNTSSAVYGLQGYTSMSPSNSASGDGVEWYQGPCTLITPLHAIGVSPFHSQGSFVNHVYRFIGSDNTHQVVTCVGHIAVTNNGTYVDLGILRFDQPIMATVDRAKFLADPSQKLPLARLSNWLSGQAITDCKLLGVPCIRVNQHKNAWIEDWCTVSASGTWLCGFRQPSLWITDPTARWTYPGGVQPGDSGHPAFAIVGSQLALGGPLYSGDDICIFGDVILSNINSGIYTVDMQTSGTNSGYTASTVDLTGFPNL